MLLLASMFLIVANAPGVSAAVTPGILRDVHPNSTPYIRDNSTAIPMFLFDFVQLVQI